MQIRSTALSTPFAVMSCFQRQLTHLTILSTVLIDQIGRREVSSKGSGIKNKPCLIYIESRLSSVVAWVDAVANAVHGPDYRIRIRLVKHPSEAPNAGIDRVERDIIACVPQPGKQCFRAEYLIRVRHEVLQQCELHGLQVDYFAISKNQMPVAVKCQRTSAELPPSPPVYL